MESIPSDILHNIWKKNVEKDYIAFARKIKNENPFMVAFSVITGRSVEYSFSLSKLIKKINKDIKIVWGGVHPSILPNQTLKSEYIDYVVSGEGEIRIKPLLDHINGSSNVDLDGISYKDGEELIINPAIKKIEDLDKWTSIHWEDYDLKRYINYDFGAPKLSYLTSRGCPFNCGFCVNESLGRNKYYITKSIEHVLTDIQYLKKKFNLKYIHINDDNFFYKRERAFEILEKIGLPYFAEGRINYINDEFCENLVSTNCRLLMCGGESGSDRVLRYIRKGQTKKQLINAAKLVGKYSIPSSWSFISGFPTETKDELSKTFKTMKLINRLASRKICKPGVFIPYPGSFLYNETIKHGGILPSNIQDWAKFERYSYGEVIPNFDYKLYTKLLKDYQMDGMNVQERIKFKYKKIIQKIPHNQRLKVKNLFGIKLNEIKKINHKLHD